MYANEVQDDNKQSYWLLGKHKHQGNILTSQALSCENVNTLSMETKKYNAGLNINGSSTWLILNILNKITTGSSN